MARKSNTAPSLEGWSPEGVSEQLKRQVHTYQCEVVTPLYGGGVKAGCVDSDMPIRATAIRGQLRFFWRLITVRQFLDDHEKIDGKSQFFAERDIFGGLGSEASSLSASRVSIQVSGVHQVNVEPCADYRKQNGTIKTYPDWKEWVGGQTAGYALFPAQGKANKHQVEREPSGLAKPGLQFELRVVFNPGLEDVKRNQVLESIRWWACFGGVGARTRRGVGSVLVKLNGKALTPVSDEEVTQKGCSLILQEVEHDDAMSAWVAGIDAMRSFRQGLGLARKIGEDSRPKRSEWPEPDAIRRIANTCSRGHEPEHKAGNLFPRAMFGLPLVFHFKDDRSGDPVSPTLQPHDLDRMASPLLLRPYWNGNSWHAAVLRLPIKSIGPLDLKLGNQKVSVVAWPDDLDARESAVETIKPMLTYKAESEPEPIAAFLAHFQSHDSPKRTLPHLNKPHAAPPKEDDWPAAQIKFNSKNGTLTVKQMKKGRPTRIEAYAHDKDAANLVEQLPKALQAQLLKGPLTANVKVLGKSILKIEVQA